MENAEELKRQQEEAAALEQQRATQEGAEQGPEPGSFDSYIEQVKAEIAQRKAAGGEGGEGGEGDAGAAGQGGQGEGGEGGQIAAQPSPIEAATNGKFKSLEELDQFIADTEKLKNQKVVSDEDRSIINFAKKYGADTWRMYSIAQTDAEKLSPQQVLAQAFAIKPENQELSPKAIEEGWQHELKTMLGRPDIFIDFEDSENNYGVGEYLGSKLNQIIGDSRGRLKEFFGSLVPNIGDVEESQAGATGPIPSLSEQVLATVAQEADAYQHFNPSGLDDLGEGAKDLKLAVAELPGFADTIKAIKANPQKWLEEQFLTKGDDGAKLNTKAMIDFAVLQQGGLPALLKSYGTKVGETRYADGLAEGTGKKVEEIRDLLGLKSPGSKGAENGEKTKEELVREKADRFWQSRGKAG